MRPPLSTTSRTSAHPIAVWKVVSSSEQPFALIEVKRLRHRRKELSMPARPIELNEEPARHRIHELDTKGGREIAYEPKALQDRSRGGFAAAQRAY